MRRAISASPSEAVEKKPPRSGSAKRAIISSASAMASLEPALLAGRFEQRDQRLEQEGVVLEVGVDLGLPVVVGAQQAPALVAQLAQDELGAARPRASR